MSYDCSGLPGIWTAVRHLVCVVVGAPGPVHWASAAPDVASDTAPNSIEATRSMPSRFGRRPISASSGSCEEPEEYIANIVLPPMSCDVSTKSKSTVYSHERPRADRSCLHGINEQIAVTNKGRSPGESFARGPPGSRETELYKMARSLAVRPKRAD